MVGRIWTATIAIRAKNRRGPTTTVGLRLGQTLRLSDDLLFRDRSGNEESSLEAEVKVEADSYDRAVSKAWDVVAEASAVVGFAAGVGLVPLRTGLTAVSPGGSGGAAEVGATESIGAVASVVVAQPPEELTDAFRRYGRLASAEREEASAILELFNAGDQEFSPRARFLTYATILDSMSPPGKRDPDTGSVAEALRSYLKLESNGSLARYRSETLSRVDARLSELGLQSTRDRLADLLVEAGLPAAEAEKDAKDTWKLRNDLSHGNAPPPATEVELGAARARMLADLCIRHKYFRPVASQPSHGSGSP
jgi:hypothetical protein